MRVARSLGSVAAAERVEVRFAPLEQLGGVLHALGQELWRLDHKDVLEEWQLASHLQEAVEEALILQDRELRLGMPRQVADLLWRRRVVDAHAGGPQELRGRVEPVEVGPVAHHEQHPVTRLHAVLLEAGRGSGHQVAVLGEGPLVPRPRLLAGHGPQGHRVAVVARRCRGRRVAR